MCDTMELSLEDLREAMLEGIYKAAKDGKGESALHMVKALLLAEQFFSEYEDEDEEIPHDL